MLDVLRRGGMSGMDVTLVDGTTKTVNVLTLGASDLNVFVGSGPYFIDSNNDGFIDENDARSPDAVGLARDLARRWSMGQIKRGAV